MYFHFVDLFLVYFSSFLLTLSRDNLHSVKFSYANCALFVYNLKVLNRCRVTMCVGGCFGLNDLQERCFSHHFMACRECFSVLYPYLCGANNK